jgi:localization factor PodJL
MASDTTWNVRGLAPEVRETAREAARRSGLTIAEWLQSVIIDSATEEKVTRGPRQSAGRDEGARARRAQRDRKPPIDPQQVQALDARLDVLSHQLERLARTGGGTATAASTSPERAAPAAPAPAERAATERAPGANPELTAALRAIETRLAELGREATVRAQGPSQQVANALLQLDQRLDKLATEGRSASSELETRIAAVDRALATLNRDTAAPAAGRREMPADWRAPDTPTRYAPLSRHGQPAMPVPEMAPRPLSAAVNDSGDSQRPTLRIRRADAPAEAPSLPRESAAAPARPEAASLGLDDAIAEIAARQQALDIEDVARPDLDRQFAELSQRLGPAPQRTELENEHLSNLQHQLRQLTDQLETLRGPGGFQEALAALRSELADIGRKLTEAAPRRALQALEAEVHTLADRVDIGRHRGGDAATLAGIERALAEVRDALHQLAPAESLATFREEVRTLDRKIDAVAAGGSDATALRHLENAVAELREIASRAASGDALIALAEEVQTLGDKIDRIVMPLAPGADVLETVNARFAQLAASLEARAAAAAPADAGNLVSIVEALADKIERMEFARDSSPALDQIAAQLGRLSEKLEASGARLSHLDTIERALGELFDQLESLHASAVAAAQRAAKDTLEVSGASAGATLELESIKNEFGALRQNQAQNDRRTQDTLEAVHDTLERLVDRLAMVETDMRGGARTSAAVLPALRPLDLPSHAPGPVQQVEAGRPPAAAPAAMAPVVAMPQERRPIDPTLPADHPLEPGTATLRGRAPAAPASPAERIAASEAALAGVKPAIEGDSKANFIAAARRAAQAAATMAPTPSGAASEETKSSVSTLGAIAQRLTGRRPLILGCAILLIAGTLHLVLNVLGTSDAPRTDAARPAAQQAVPASEPAKVSSTSAKPMPPSTSIVPPITSSNLPPLGILSTQSRSPAPAEREPALDTATSVPREPAPPAAVSSPPAPEARDTMAPQGQDARTVASVSPLTIASIKLPTGDVTGSTGRAPAFSLSNGAPTPSIPGAAPAAAGDRLPAAVSPGLRTAALSGNPAAEYEIALRYAEGRGIPVNLEEAANWFERAAGRGVAPAQYRLGSLYEKGQGVKKDIEKARRLYTSAAEKGNAKAMHNLAVLNAEGVDGKPDFKVAAHWFRKAADRGVADSQYNLAILHARGLGVEQNLAESYKWFALAAQQGDQDAGKKRDDVAGRLDQQALVAARLAVQTFTAAPQPEEATSVKTPAGGWDAAAPAAPAKPKSAFPSRRSGSS